MRSGVARRSGYFATPLSGLTEPGFSMPSITIENWTHGPRPTHVDALRMSSLSYFPVTRDVLRGAHYLCIMSDIASRVNLPVDIYTRQPVKYRIAFQVYEWRIHEEKGQEHQAGRGEVELKASLTGAALQEVVLAAIKEIESWLEEDSGDSSEESSNSGSGIDLEEEFEKSSLKRSSTSI